MELFEEILREYRFGVETIQEVAKKLNTHRRMVRQALANAISAECKRLAGSSPKLEPVREFVDGILQSHRQAPRKQRHTAYQTLVIGSMCAIRCGKLHGDPPQTPCCHASASPFGRTAALGDRTPSSAVSYRC